MGSKRPNKFGQEDLDILSQISAQISLALDNALAYGRLSASRNRLEDERLYLESEIHAEYNFEDIVARAPLCAKSLTRSRLSPQRDLPSCYTARRAPAKNWLRAQSMALDEHCSAWRSPATRSASKGCSSTGGRGFGS